MGKRASTTPLVSDYFVKHPNVIISDEDIAQATGLNHSQISAAIRTMASLVPEVGKYIEVIVRAHSWRYTPGVEHAEPPRSNRPVAYANGRLFVQIGVRKDGTLVLEDEDGALFSASQL